MNGETSGLMVLEAQQRSAAIETSVPTREVATAVMTGVVVIVKHAFETEKLRRLRSLIVSAELPFRDPDFHEEESWRSRREVYVDGAIAVLHDSCFLAVERTEDEIGRAARVIADPLAAYWRALTGDPHTFAAGPNRRALRCWAMQYPAGGGCFRWHQHLPLPTKIGIILALSERGVDFRVGGTEFKTPFGVVDASPRHDIGDICLFRYDLPHRVAPVDPDRELRWDGTGRWTFLIQGDPRPVREAPT